MSKKDYIKFAKMIKSKMDDCMSVPNPSDDRLMAIESTIKSFAYKTADIFADDNPNFDRDRFLAACGVKK